MTVYVLQFTFGELGMSEKLSGMSAYQYRRRWDAILKFLGIPSSQKSGGPTPGTIRGSGATSEYMRSEDIPKIAWRGRWRTLSSLEHYLQEAAARFLLNQLPESTRSKVDLFGQACEPLLVTYLQSSSSDSWVQLINGNLQSGCKH